MISDDYTRPYIRPPYPQLPPHFQTSHMRKLIRDAYLHGINPRYIAEIMRVAEEPVAEILKGCNPPLMQKSRLSTKQLKKLHVANWGLLQGIQEARWYSISRRFRDEEIEFVEDYAPIGSHDQRRISSAPGTTLSSIADFFSSKKTRKFILAPIIADMQEEYFDSLMEDRIWKARWVRIRGCWAFWQSWGIAGFLKTVADVWKLLAG